MADFEFYNEETKIKLSFRMPTYIKFSGTISNIYKKQRKASRPSLLHIVVKQLLSSYFIGNSKSFSSFGPTASKYFSAISSRHSFTESVLVSFFSNRWLKCPFHRSIFLNNTPSNFRTAKVCVFI
jgi:putative component of membrane protein insertase Oxa1/YidC/SpoIIIJ protein YidD